MNTCAECGRRIATFRGVTTVDVNGKQKHWHWRCYHRGADSRIDEDGTSRKMTADEFVAHQAWADANSDDDGNWDPK